MNTANKIQSAATVVVAPQAEAILKTTQPITAAMLEKNPSTNIAYNGTIENEVIPLTKVRMWLVLRNKGLWVTPAARGARS